MTLFDYIEQEVARQIKNTPEYKALPANTYEQIKARNVYMAKEVLLHINAMSNKELLQEISDYLGDSGD